MRYVKIVDFDQLETLYRKHSQSAGLFSRVLMCTVVRDETPHHAMLYFDRDVYAVDFEMFYRDRRDREGYWETLDYICFSDNERLQNQLKDGKYEIHVMVTDK